MAGIKIIYGTAGRGFRDTNELEHAKHVLDTLKKYEVKTLDSAQVYGTSEEVLGDLDAGSYFTIDTKALGGFVPGSLSDSLYEKAHESLSKLKVKQVGIFYVHAPDDTISPKVWVPTMDKLFKEGVFCRLGLSNFTPDQVKDVYNTAKEGNLVLPSVYQGNYSPIARLQEDTLFPLLRELKIAFYAYSPLAGGFLTKSKEDILSGQNTGRFSKGNGLLAEMYSSMYVKPSYLEALSEWAVAAEEEGCTKAELAYRWVSYHSPLKPEQDDGLIFSGSTLEQVKQTIEGLRRGPLKPETIKKIDHIWETIKHEAPLDNYNSFMKKG